MVDTNPNPNSQPVQKQLIPQVVTNIRKWSILEAQNEGLIYLQIASRKDDRKADGQQKIADREAIINKLREDYNALKPKSVETDQTKLNTANKEMRELEAAIGEQQAVLDVLKSLARDFESFKGMCYSMKDAVDTFIGARIASLRSWDEWRKNATSKFLASVSPTKVSGTAGTTVSGILLMYTDFLDGLALIVDKLAKDFINNPAWNEIISKMSKPTVWVIISAGSIAAGLSAEFLTQLRIRTYGRKQVGQHALLTNAEEKYQSLIEEEAKLAVCHAKLVNKRFSEVKGAYPQYFELWKDGKWVQFYETRKAEINKLKDELRAHLSEASQKKHPACDKELLKQGLTPEENVVQALSGKAAETAQGWFKKTLDEAKKTVSELRLLLKESRKVHREFFDARNNDVKKQ